jgi:hypothetical protein
MWKFEKGTLKTLKKNGKTFMYAVVTLPSINSSGEYEESVELFELPDRKEAEQKAQDVELTYGRIKEVINLVDCGKLSDEQGIKRIMKAITKQVNRQIKKEFGVK